MFTAYQPGIRVPQELTIVDDDMRLAQQVWSPLTTLRQPFRQIAEMATQLLVDLFKDHPVTRVNLGLPTELVVRQSATVPPKTRSSNHPAH